MNTTKQIKLFSKIHQEFINECNSEEILIKIKKDRILSEYLEDANENIDDFIGCNSNCLDKLRLLKLTSTDFSVVKIDWTYLHNLYWIVKKDIPKEMIELSKVNIENSKMPVLYSEAEAQAEAQATSPIFGDILKEMSGDILSNLKGADLSKINPAELMASLMNPDNSSDKIIGGINFSEIIKKTSKTLSEKVKDGKINLDSLKDISEEVAKKLPKNL